MGIAIAIFCSRSDGPPSCWIGQPKPSSSSGRTNGVQYRARYFDARPHPSRLGVAAAGGVPSKKTEIVAAVRPAGKALARETYWEWHRRISRMVVTLVDRI